MARTQGAQPKNGNAVTHGLHKMKLMLKELGTTPIDGRSAVAVALRDYAAELAADLGGSPSTAQATIIDLCGRQKVLLDSIDSWLFNNTPIKVEGNDVKLASVIKDREQIASNLAKYLGMLGLQRKAKPITALTTYLESRGTLGPDTP